jgi:hypothetical protein
MFKDIVAELRGYGDCVTSQAADEIERLKGENDRLRGIIEFMDSAQKLASDPLCAKTGIPDQIAQR